MSPPPVLYVEDEENDVLFMQMAFSEARVASPLLLASDGEEALNYLGGKGAFSDRQRFPLPALVLLDLKLPLLPGISVLRWIRQQPHLASLPVVVFTSSDQPSDREHAQQMGASEFIVKAPGFEHTIALARHLADRWLRREA